MMPSHSVECVAERNGIFIAAHAAHPMYSMRALFGVTRY